MDRKKTISDWASKEWYVQGFNATPFLILSAGMNSGLEIMPKKLGFGYTEFLCVFENDTCGAHYLVEDFAMVYGHYKKETAANPDYLFELKRQYEKVVAETHIFFKKLEKEDFSNKSLPELFSLAKYLYLAIADSVGVAHIIEAISLLGEEEVRAELKEYIPDKKVLNETLIALSTATEMSFAYQSESRLLDIQKLPETKQGEAIKKYLRDFGWVNNSYAGRVVLTEKDVLDEARTISSTSAASKRDEKSELVARYKLPSELKAKIDILAFATAWQDERKKNILIAIDYTERVLEVIGKKISLKIELLRYALPEEFDDSLSSKIEELEKRRLGSIYLCARDKTEILTGKEYQDTVLLLKRKETETLGDIRGTSASLGVVSGRVKICTSLSSIDDVVEGDILVASMTRPEYLPAMRKAAAFVTDEGGITCHAAIVAREMGKPCVIGTKVATKVLKDGMTVEVNANHGVVKILKEGKPKE